MRAEKLKSLLKEMDFRPSKKMGQNFLVSERLAHKIAGEVRKAPPPWVEIGPGPGALTEMFLPKEKESLILVERDKKLAARWKAAGLRVFQEDALRLDWRLLPAPFALFGNLPYSIAGSLILESLLFAEKISRMVFMMQKEVAQRVMARPGGKAYGLLGAAVPLFWEARFVADAEERDFRPAPRVKGRVLSFHPRKERMVSDPAGFLRFAKGCFSKRRKILLRHIPGVSPEEARELFLRLGLPPKVRAEELSPERLAALYSRLAKGSPA